MTMPPESWSWWEARRLRYNLALIVSGLAAYAVSVGLFMAFGVDVMGDWRLIAGMTIWGGVGYLGFIVFANLCYLLGPVTESLIHPQDAEGFRQRLFNLGFWTSALLPFTFPLMTLAWLLTASPFLT
jgi:hypothetical protein